jgi:hypothetical protein
MMFEFCKSVNSYDIPVLRDKWTCISNSIKILVKWKEPADQTVIKLHLDISVETI